MSTPVTMFCGTTRSTAGSARHSRVRTVDSPMAKAMGTPRISSRKKLIARSANASMSDLLHQRGGGPVSGRIGQVLYGSREKLEEHQTAAHGTREKDPEEGDLEGRGYGDEAHAERQDKSPPDHVIEKQEDQQPSR